MSRCGAVFLPLFAYLPQLSSTAHIVHSKVIDLLSFMAPPCVTVSLLLYFTVFAAFILLGTHFHLDLSSHKKK